MSFSAYARQTRDPASPFGRRVSTLRSCVQLYRPIGFHATLSFLEELAGPFERDAAALLRALDILAESRNVRRASLDRYAVVRRAAKHRGQRSPHPHEVNPHQLRGYWFGAPRQAAVHALRYWRRGRLSGLLVSTDPTALQLDSCVTACLAAAGPLTPPQRQLLAVTTETLRERIQTGLWRDDQAAYFRTQDLLRIARFVEVAADHDTGPDQPAQ